MRPIVLVAFLASLMASTPLFANDEAAQARRVVDISVPGPDTIQRLTLSDGSQLFGQVQSIETDSVVFRTIAGALVTVSRAEISDLRVAGGRIVAGEFLPTDAHNTRLMFAPTARALRRGEGYFGIYYFMPFVQVGVTDRFSLGGGTPLLFTGEDAHPFWFTPKMQLLGREKVQVAAGLIHIATPDQDAGIAYGVTTLGPADRAVTLGLGYAYSGEDRTPIVMIGGEYRASRRIKWITENWLWREGPGFASGGVRFVGERLSADVSLIVPLLDEVFVFPLVSFAWHF